MIDALTQQGQPVVPHALFLTRVVEQRGPIAAQMMTLIKGPQRQQTGIASDLPAGKIALHGTIAVEKRTCDI